MRNVILPGTDVSVSRLAFGTANLHHEFPPCAAFGYSKRL